MLALLALHNHVKKAAGKNNVHDVSVAQVDLWLDAMRVGRWSPPLYAYELVMQRSLVAAERDAIAPWLVADVLCRIDPDELDPMRSHHAFLTLPDALMREVVRALGATLSPEDAGNPLGLYDWLASRASPDAPAFARGVVDPDPRVRLICARVTGRRPTTSAPWSLGALRRGFEAIREREAYGNFGLLAIDHEARRCEVLTWLDPSDDREARKALDEAAMALTLGGALDVDDMAARCLATLSAGDAQIKEATWSPTDLTKVRARLIDTCVSDDPKASRVEATLRVEAMLACVEADVVCREAPDVARVAWSQGWFLQHPSRRYSIAIVYLNDQ